VYGLILNARSVAKSHRLRTTDEIYNANSLLDHGYLLLRCCAGGYLRLSAYFKNDLKRNYPTHTPTRMPTRMPTERQLYGKYKKLGRHSISGDAFKNRI
jgi:hypothetical protein